MTSVISVDGAAPGPDDGGPFSHRDVCSSPGGVYKALARARNDTGFLTVWYSSDGGTTWTATTSPAASAASGFTVGAWDNGTLFLVEVITLGGGTVARSYRFSGGVWTGPVLIWNPGFVTTMGCDLGTDGTNLYVRTAIGTAAPVWLSTNGGASWALVTNPGAISFTYTEALFLEASVGNGFFMFITFAGGSWHLDRFNASTGLFDVINLNIGGTAGSVNIFSDGTNTGVYVVVSHGTTIDIMHSSDSGATWASVCTAESLPGGLNHSAIQGGVTFGADGNFYIYGKTAGLAFQYVTRDTAAVGTYSALISIGAFPGASGLSSVSPTGFDGLRADGGYNFTVTMFVAMDTTAGVNPPGEIDVLLIPLPVPFVFGFDILRFS